MSILSHGDTVELIAPASRCSEQQLIDIKQLVESWGLNCLLSADIFGDDILCANSDEARFKHLERALNNPLTKAIICVRGGYGSMRLIPKLRQMAQPKSSKILVGMSDITSLQLYIQQQWNWPIIHGAAVPGKFSPESIASLKSILFGETKQLEFTKLTPLNEHAKSNRIINSSLTGGNLSIIQAGVGTAWELDGRNKIVLLEEIGERAYRVDRLLEHLLQANLLQHASAIVFADFLEGNEPNGTSLIQEVLNRFAQDCAIPVVQIQGIGHGYINAPIPFGTATTLQLGDEIKLTCLSLTKRTV